MVRAPLPFPVLAWETLVDLTDPRQFEYAYRQHVGRVRATAQRVLHDAAAAEDVTQEVFIRLWQRPQLFDPRRGSLAALLAVMGRDSALGRACDRLGELHSISPSTEEGPAEALERREGSADLRRALLKLPPAQRETVALAYGRELSSAEIAERTHVGRATARSRLRLGLGKLRTDLGRAA
jgi:RNA polymerase sigma-70 factor (ECF subfamily)